MDPPPPYGVNPWTLPRYAPIVASGLQALAYSKWNRASDGVGLRYRKLRFAGALGAPRGPSRRPAGRFKRRYRKRYFGRRPTKYSRKGRRSRLRAFRTKIQKTTLRLNRYILTQHTGNNHITSTNGNTTWNGFDIGLTGSGIAPSPPAFPVDGKGDVFRVAEQLDGTNTSNSSCKVMIRSSHHIVLRNNNNFGCYLKVYWVKAAHEQTISNHQTANEILQQTVSSTRLLTGCSHATDLTDFPDFSTYLTIYKRKVYKFMPGETLTFKIVSPVSKNIHTLRYLLSRNVGRHYRGIIFQATGFPLHLVDTPGTITTGGVNISCVGHQRTKGRMIPIDLDNQNNRSSTINVAGNLEGQQWQTGTETTSNY